LIEQARAELPAEPKNVDRFSEAFGAAFAAGESVLEEIKLRGAVKAAEVFRERHSRLPLTWQELLDDPVCGKILDRQQAALANQILEAIESTFGKAVGREGEQP